MPSASPHSRSLSGSIVVPIRGGNGGGVVMGQSLLAGDDGRVLLVVEISFGHRGSRSAPSANSPHALRQSSNLNLSLGRHFNLFLFF